MQIVIVDDDPVSRHILRASLNHAGYQVIEKNDGQSAWEYLLREPARFIITDWMMPLMDGPDLIRKIRAADFPGYVYIIILTAKDDKTDVVDGLQAGADDYLTKPYNIDELHARLTIGERMLDLEDRIVRARDQMEQMAMHDSLTELLNRRAIYNHAEAELNRAKRELHSVSLILMDVDKFKHVNDTHGHLAGDRALCFIAEQISQSVRSYDWVGRWGGDEFLVVLPNTNLTTAQIVADRIHLGISAKFLTLCDGSELNLRVSMGIATGQTEGELSLDTLIQRADEALYEAKQGGKDRIALWQPSTESTTNIS